MLRSEGSVFMGVATTIACVPIGEIGEEQRSSRNFGVNQLPPDKHLVWHIISQVGDTGISFDVKQKGPSGANVLKYEHITDGMITDYEALRNLYISNPQHATGHFMVRVESCE